MKLNHINLPVTDIAPPRDFFVKYFGMETIAERGRGALAILRDEGGLVLVLSRFGRSAEVHYHEDFHVGFYLEDREDVVAMHARMVDDGLEVDAPKPRAGRFGFYIQAPGGFVVEVATFELD